MVAVPAGVFLMGCNEEIDDSCMPEEKPFRKVFVEKFFIDVHEVTVAEYRRCVKAGACVYPPPLKGCNHSRRGRENHPVNCVSNIDAKAFCSFVGKTLPTEEQWEKAARGTDGRLFPWGNEFDPKIVSHGDGGRIDGYKGTAPVGSFPEGASPYGVLDMAGNVWEWTRTEYKPTGPPKIVDPTLMPYEKPEPRMVFKGGGDQVDGVWPLRSSGRTWSRQIRNTPILGFRCAREAK